MPEYADYLPVQRLRPVLSLSADGHMVAYASDASGQFNLWIQPVSGGPARQLTFFTGQSIRQIAWAPDGRRLVFTADTHGDEQTQVYVVTAGGGDPVRLSAAGDRQYRIGEINSFDPSGRYVLCGGNDRDQAVPDLILYDLSGGPALRFEGVPGRIVYPVAFAADGHRILAGSWGANTDFQSYIADITRAEAGLVPVTAHLPGSFYYPGPWDGEGFLVRTTTDQEGLARLGRVSVPDGTLTIIDSPPWDVEEQIAVAADGQVLVWTVNDDGRSVLRGQKNGARLDMPAIPDGVVHAVQVPGDASAAVLLLDTPGRPMEVAVADLGGDQVRYLTDTRPPAAAPVVPELCHYPARDGTPIPAWLYRPPGPGPHPIVLYIHGGPESQARPVYNALFQCLLASGIAIMAPNVRGSTGYGQAWQKRIYRDWGGIDLADFEAAASYLRAQHWADPDRIAVLGKSYGGFAALSCVSRLPGLWAAAVSAYGPSNLETLARTVPPDWATIVATMFGDPDENAEDLRERSPVTYADQIAAPLLVIQGAKDPRVPKAESDQIVDRARANGAEVEYLVFEDEGHGFTSRENDIKAHTAIVEFLAKHLQLCSARLPRTGLGNFREADQRQGNLPSLGGREINPQVGPATSFVTQVDLYPRRSRRCPQVLRPGPDGNRHAGGRSLTAARTAQAELQVRPVMPEIFIGSLGIPIRKMLAFGAPGRARRQRYRGIQTLNPKAFRHPAHSPLQARTPRSQLLPRQLAAVTEGFYEEAQPIDRPPYPRGVRPGHPPGEGDRRGGRYCYGPPQLRRCGQVDMQGSTRVGSSHFRLRAARHPVANNHGRNGQAGPSMECRRAPFWFSRIPCPIVTIW
jgi:dipeptidyl aminopeptidase/acylaminoacyl peptidase